MRRAFTLVELLVVIAIIVLLMAILLPSLGSARQRVKEIVCASNFKQLGVVFTMYANDYSLWLPPYDCDIWWRYDLDNNQSTVSNFWPILRSYITKENSNKHYASWGRIFFCPCVKTDRFKSYNSSSGYWEGFRFDGNARANYLFRLQLPPSYATPHKPRKITMVDCPPKDGFTFNNFAIAKDLTLTTSTSSSSNHLRLSGSATGGVVPPNDKGNFLFVDGSVRQLRRGESGFSSSSFAR